MGPLILALPGNEAMAERLAGTVGGSLGGLRVRQFPDGETYVRIEEAVAGRDMVLVCTLHRPDDKLLPLAFAAATARDLGAARVGLVAPYLAYMRQDRRFQPGEGITSTYFARLLSGAVDWIVTVDPHLHRRSGLGEIYSIPASVVHAAPLLSAWIAEYVPHPLVIGPDAESEQWAAAVASGAGAPSVVLQKVRRGDRDVEVRLPPLDRWRGYTPVLVDDIVSTARTMIQATRELRAGGFDAPVCLAVHGVFARGAYEELRESGVREVVTCDTIPHPSNGIGLGPLLATEIRGHMSGSGSPLLPGGSGSLPR